MKKGINIPPFLAHTVRINIFGFGGYRFAPLESGYISPQVAASGDMLQALDSLFLNLADTLAGESELLADFLKGECALAVDSEIEGDHLRLALGQS